MGGGGEGRDGERENETWLRNLLQCVVVAATVTGGENQLTIKSLSI